MVKNVFLYIALPSLLSTGLVLNYWSLSFMHTMFMIYITFDARDIAEKWVCEGKECVACEDKLKEIDVTCLLSSNFISAFLVVISWSGLEEGRKVSNFIFWKVFLLGTLARIMRVISSHKSVKEKVK